MKEKILELRNQNLSYSQISKILKCSKSTISYYCGKKQKEKTLLRQKNNRKNTIEGILQVKWGNFIKRTGNPYKIKIKDILNKFGNNPICYITGDLINLKDSKSYHFDHIIPKSKGGNNDLNNLGLTTKNANQMKYDMSIEELLIMCKKIINNLEA